MRTEFLVWTSSNLPGKPFFLAEVILVAAGWTSSVQPWMRGAPQAGFTRTLP